MIRHATTGLSASMVPRSDADAVRDPSMGWGVALAFASVFPGAGAMLGADIVRVYVFWLGLLALALAVIGGIGTLYERCARSSDARRPARAPDDAEGAP